VTHPFFGCDHAIPFETMGFCIIKMLQQGDMHICCFAIFESIEQKLLNLECFFFFEVSIKINLPVS